MVSYAVPTSGSLIASFLDGTVGIAATAAANAAPVASNVTITTAGYLALLGHTETSGTTGGTATAGSWQTRTINVEDYDADNIVSISANQFTLGAGTYSIEAWASANDCGRYQLRIYDATNTNTEAIGISHYIRSPSVDGKNWSYVGGLIAVSGSTAFEIQARVDATGTYGPAFADPTDDEERHIYLKIQQVA